MEQIIITSNSSSELNKKIKEKIEEGFEPVGSHQVVTTHIQNRFSGTQHKDSLYRNEYSQTMRKG